MDIENTIFQRYSVNIDKLKDYGFIKSKRGFVFEKFFHDNLFKVIVFLDKDGNISTKVYDIESNDEFLPIKVENSQGSFVSEIRNEYEKMLENIRDNCFEKKYFVYPQSNRITNFILEKYGDVPEFLWDKFKGSGIFRNKKTNKWYAAILEVSKNKLLAEGSGLIEVLDIKLSRDNIQKYLKYSNFYPAYHMNKKHWISLILDDSVNDDKIIELIEESYKLVL